jgi:acetylornithine/N-succinyldiaminopimelate aminotransferase
MEYKYNTLRSMFYKHVAQTATQQPALQIKYANGCYMYDMDDKPYIDFISGISVSSLGHNNPLIIQAVQQQIARHLHVMVYGEYVLAPQVNLAEKLAELLPPSLSQVYFTNSGAEAVEGAMKLSKRKTGRTKMVSCYNAYHGSTQGALSLMGNEFFKQAFRPLLPDVHHIQYNDIEQLQYVDTHTACVIVEPVQSETGYIMGTQQYMKSLRQRCDEVGALLIFDEAQSGMGRTGKLFGFEHFHIVPDVLVLAKAFGAGFPLGAFVSSHEIMSALSYDPPLGHITTFGGHPVSCAASLAALHQLNEPGFFTALQENALYLKEQLSQVFGSDKLSGLGMMIAVRMRDEKQCSAVIDDCLKNGLIADWFLFAPHSIRIAPPLIMDKTTIHKACSILKQAYLLNK